MELLISVLHVHHKIEDESFWPKLRDRGSAAAAALVNEMLAHHASIETLSSEITSGSAADSAKNDRNPCKKAA